MKTKELEFRTHGDYVEALKKDLLEDVPEIRRSELLDFIEARRKVTITVKFHTMDREVFTQTYAAVTTIKQVKEILKEVFNVSPTMMELTSEDGRVLADNVVLLTVNFDKHYQVDLYLRSLDPSRYISAKHAYKTYTIPDIITVTVVYDDCTSRNIVVEIENQSILKPFLGGYLDKITQIEYHHGYTQTGPKKQNRDAAKTTERCTQTQKLSNKKQETAYSTATQMSNAGIYIPNVNDKILTAGPYETAAEREARLNVEAHVRTIQRYFRAWKMRNALKAFHAEYQKRLQMEQQETRYQERMDTERRTRELIGKVFPRTKSDFFMLYTMLENWKKAEIERIKDMVCGPAKIAEMYLLLEKEISMLMSIERQKKTMDQDRKVRKDLDFLKMISTPLSWNSDYKNLHIEMDTLETQKGRQYVEMFRKLCDNSSGFEGRLEAYLDVKMSLSDHTNCTIGLEIVNLIDRACLLMARGMRGTQLESLHKRIEALVMQHYRLKECNEDIALRFHRVEEKQMVNNLFYCHRCKAYKTHEEFEIQPTTKKLLICRNCSFSDKIMEPWINIQPFHFLLKLIRRDERRQSSHCSIAFILTAKDIHHIVTQIWQSHSAVSSMDDVYKLRLCRFFRDLDWAPWNCVLLSYEESKTHLRIEDLKKVYDADFLDHVRHKHMLAKRYFERAVQLNNFFQDIGKVDTRWSEIIEKEEFVALNSKTKLFLTCH